MSRSGSSGSGHGGHDRLDQGDPARRAPEDGVSVAEDPAVGGYQPVPVPGQGWRDGHDRLVELDPARRQP